MNEKHFHGVSHSRGGFDIDESTLDPDARYWMNGAEGARLALEKITKNSDDLIKDFWNVGNTWKTICERTEKVLKTAREAKSPAFIEPEQRKAEADAIAEEYETAQILEWLPSVTMAHSTRDFTVDITNEFNCGHTVTASPEWIRRHL
jgi:hypothetical protein